MKMVWKRRQVLQLAGALALLPVFPKRGRAALPVLAGPTMGTHYQVHIQQAPNGLYLPRLKHSVEQVLESTESLMSTYRSTSELSRFNASSSMGWQELSADTMRVVKAGLRVQSLSEGAFNPAAGPLVEYWGFGANPPASPNAKNPPPQKLRNAVVNANIELGPDRLRKNQPQAALDLNGIAKGDAIDRIARVLEQFEIYDYLIEIGGEIRASGAGPSGTDWVVGLENPTGDMLAGINLAGKAVATSGDYINYFNQNGKRYSHLIDPRSGKPIDHDLTLVNVIAESAMEADAWATALMVMGANDGYSYARKNELAVLFLKRSEDSYRVIMTPEFEKSRFSDTGGYL